MIRNTLILGLALALASCQSSSDQSSYDPPPASYSDNSNSYGYTGNDGYNPNSGYAGESAAPAPAPAPQRRGLFSKLPHRDAAYIGLPLQEAEGLAQSRGLSTRVVMIDGVAQPGTVDVNPNRVNFKVKGGYVRAVARG